jgi:vanillate O-demethylase monooxygenase subunit
VADTEGDNRRAVQPHSCQTLTPETATSTHHFIQQSHRVDGAERDDAERIVQSIHDSLLSAFDENRDMIRAQARNLALAPGAAMLALARDAALLRFRRLIDEQLRLEQPSSTPV